MPCILEHSPANVIRNIRFHQPFAVVDVVCFGSLMNDFPRHSKLGATRYTNFLWDSFPWKKFLKGLLIHTLGGNRFPRNGIRGVEKRFNLNRAAKNPDAA